MLGKSRRTSYLPKKSAGKNTITGVTTIRSSIPHRDGQKYPHRNLVTLWLKCSKTNSNQINKDDKKPLAMSFIPTAKDFRHFVVVIYYSNSFLPSCFMVFFIGLDGENQEVLSDFYLLCGFSRDYIVILLSLTISIKAFMAILKISSHNSLNRMVIPKLL